MQTLAKSFVYHLLILIVSGLYWMQPVVSQSEPTVLIGTPEGQ